MNKLSGKAIRWILYSFVLSNIAGSLYCLWRAMGEYQERKYFGVFFYHHLSSHIGLNAIYFSMYCVFCIFILVYYFLTRKMPFWTRIFSIASIVYLLIIVVLLSSKMFIFVFCLSALVIAFYSYRFFRRIQPGLAVLFLLLFAVPILSTKFTFVSSRIMETKLQEYRGTIDDQNGLAVRGVLWKSSWKLIVQRPLLGWGRIGGQEELRKLVGEAGFQEGAKKNYNSHNQYLYTWLCYGLPGILLFVSMLVTYLVAFIRKKQFFGIYLISSFMLAISTESMMETQRGIVFFFLFTTIFLYHFLPQRTSKVLAG